MWSDIRYGLRHWKTSKSLIFIVTLLLGIGIGANTLIFSFVNAAILKPLPVRDPGNLFLIEKDRARRVRPDIIPFTESEGIYVLANDADTSMSGRSKGETISILRDGINLTTLTRLSTRLGLGRHHASCTERAAV